MNADNSYSYRGFCRGRLTIDADASAGKALKTTTTRIFITQRKEADSGQTLLRKTFIERTYACSNTTRVTPVKQMIFCFIL